MANIEKHDSKDLHSHVNHKPAPDTRSTTHDHDVLNLNRHLAHTDGTRGSSVSQPQHHLAKEARDYDDSARFTTNQPNLIENLLSKEEGK